jgi:hypothetical protein
VALLELYDASGTLYFDSDSQAGGVPVGAFAGGAGTITFPEFAGRSMQALYINGSATDDWMEAFTPVSIDYALGYPRVVCGDASTPLFLLAVF